MENLQKKEYIMENLQRREHIMENLQRREHIMENLQKTRLKPTMYHNVPQCTTMEPQWTHKGHNVGK